MPVAQVRGYDSFVGPLAIAKAGAVAEAGLHWATRPGLSLMVTVPTAWVRAKVFGGYSGGAPVTKGAPNVQARRVPAPRFWPGGALPAGMVIAQQTQPEHGPILFPGGHVTDYRGKMAGLGWQFDSARGGWHFRRPAPARRAA